MRISPRALGSSFVTHIPGLTACAPAGRSSVVPRVPSASVAVTTLAPPLSVQPVAGKLFQLSPGRGAYQFVSLAEVNG